ncbi:MAG TPA: SprT family zinc-dependent metalloprotease [Gammaproteobacteria bacterium]|nr:SprT family zinc-dependent metalloprotease [Gammaproteobacteria bacterium]
MSELMSYHWRRSPRAKQLQVRITPWQGIEVVIPKRTSKQRVRSFLTRQRKWIRDTWERMQSQIVDADRRLPDTLALRAIGEHWQILYRRRSGKQVRIVSHGRTLIVHHPGDDEPACRTALRSWLARRARECLGAKALRMSAATGNRYRRLQIRGQKSRWGSCSSSGTLSLNYKLLFLEPELVRYLLVHELSHTRVLDHSPRFWKLVAQYEPRWRELDAELGEAWRDVPAWVEAI